MSKKIKANWMVISVAKNCRRDHMQPDSNKVNYPLLSKHNAILSNMIETSLTNIQDIIQIFWQEPRKTWRIFKKKQ